MNFTIFFSLYAIMLLFNMNKNKHTISAMSYPEIKLVGFVGSGIDESKLAPAEKQSTIIK